MVEWIRTITRPTAPPASYFCGSGSNENRIKICWRCGFLPPSCRRERNQPVIWEKGRFGLSACISHIKIFLECCTVPLRQAHVRVSPQNVCTKRNPG
jgi:hypothetical protein